MTDGQEFKRRVGHKKHKRTQRRFHPQPESRDPNIQEKNGTRRTPAGSPRINAEENRNFFLSAKIRVLRVAQPRVPRFSQEQASEILRDTQRF